MAKLPLSCSRSSDALAVGVGAMIFGAVALGIASLIAIIYLICR
jgi:hypothetical protein